MENVGAIQKSMGMLGSPRETVLALLDVIDVKENGGRPWDVQIHQPKVYPRFISEGCLGLGEAYMDGDWDCDDLTDFFDRILSANFTDRVDWWRMVVPYLRARFLNLQSIHRSREVAERHYDLGNTLYKKMLDKRMVYSCAYWKDTDDLDTAQENKLDLVCRKLGLKAGMKVLDVGCGWGSFACFAAERYGVEVEGITISKEQLPLAEEHCAGLPVQFHLRDYRKVTGQWDRVVSIGMLEHVGRNNYDDFMTRLRDWLTPDGMALVHTIVGRYPVRRADPWMTKYIFPGGMTPTPGQLGASIEGKLVLEDLHNIGADYDKTLMAWWANFERAWPELKDSYDERFYRMWRYYHHYCAGSFRARYNHVFQMVLSKRGVRGGYEAVR
ncbi:MAG: cyclopropane fatty acyl phospholipid synthase [Candidatus Hydrogenedentes bacterium]|nr:cyclopropane fatty acyl phospholipid synthase [Candidatus Hydrogenedentota bacterium]